MKQSCIPCAGHAHGQRGEILCHFTPILRTNLRRAWSYNISEAFKFMLQLARLSLDIFNFTYLKIAYNLPKVTHALMNSNSLKILITCIFVCICACKCRCLWRYFGAGVTGGSKYPAWVLETKLGSSDRTMHSLSH